ncbi:uncharacterized protein LOC126666911 [Mercurialis annua]|uniref:uncharacterized protein LOC126666911 n=1 Tax=Mercurialis annua TaxID=3986 RepID=UPI00215F1E0F|nr:uncharacterized protein LOC126666911 [Mercurialis annua]XP_050215776.1 uncharacterized protein LOC126666911 [Mercurialis annua]
MPGYRRARVYALFDEEEAPPAQQVRLGNGGPPEVHQNGFLADGEGSPEIHQNGVMNKGNGRVEARVRSVTPEELPVGEEEEPSEESEQEEDPSEDPSEDSDVEVFRSGQFWSETHRYRDHREVAALRANQAEASLNSLRAMLNTYSRGVLSIETYTSEFLRMMQAVPQTGRDNEEVNRRYVRGLGPDFAELFDFTDEHMGSIASRAAEIVSEREWNDNPVQPFYFPRERPVSPVHRDEASGSVARGVNAPRRARGPRMRVVRRGRRAPGQAAPGVQ